MSKTSEIKLTSFSHGGGCGCKIAPAALEEILEKIPHYGSHPDLLVGLETSDDAAVYKINDDQAIVATTDFFMPIVDDPYDFGRIAATNALSDIYAMGARPIMALAIVGMPVARLPTEVIQQVVAGGAAVCRDAGVPIAGGHSIDSPEPIYGLAALGLVHPQKILRNNQARDGDAVILGKGLGIGIMSAALKKGTLSAAAYVQMLSSATQLNTVGSRLAGSHGIHAVTDVTGFGVLGHLMEICRGSGLHAEIMLSKLPLLPEAVTLARDGYATGAGERNWASYGHAVNLPKDIAPWQQTFLCDPQTSGGLMATCAPEAAPSIVALFHQEGFPYARVIGRLKAGTPQITVN
ncbi:selenide, water dikinase SelD [Acidithiobacillus sp.]|uniref:selenide, water dikinase SelD n=1 Tax=Acidithiobacillus sp. TaxID=1872118 RepID=UPI003D06856E